MTTQLPDWMDSFAQPNVPDEIRYKYLPVTTMTIEELRAAGEYVLHAKQPLYTPPPPQPKLPECPTDFAGLMDVLLGGAK